MAGVPPIWVTTAVPLKLSGSLGGRASILEAKSGTLPSFGASPTDIVMISGAGVPLVLVVLVIVALADCTPPPAFAMFGKVLLIKGLSAAAPSWVEQVVGSRGDGQAVGAPVGCRVRWSASIL